MPYGDTLFQRLRLAKRPDLEGLLEDLKLEPAKFLNATEDDLVNAISAELRSAAGNSIANVRRDPHEFSYKQILIDVADKLAPGCVSWTKYKLAGPETELEIEDFIYGRVRALTEQYLMTMDANDKAKLQSRLEAALRASGIPEHAVHSSLAAVAAGTFTGVSTGPLIATVVFGGLWSWLFGLTAAQLLWGGIIGGGPVGIAVAAGIVASGTSYSKTIPAVSRLIMVRLSHEAEAELRSGQ